MREQPREKARQTKESLFPMESPAAPSPFNNPAEQSRLQALQAAGKQVDENINQDAKFPELWDLFTSGASSDYTIVESEAHFHPERVLHLPNILLEQYDRA